MKKGFFLGVLVYALNGHFSLFASEMKSINFTQKGEMSELEFVFDSNNVEASKFQVKEDKQIIVDITNVTALEKVLKALDTSQFSGGVVFVKAYKKPGSDKDIRVAIQLRDNVRSVLVRKTNRVVIQIENRYGVFSINKVEDGKGFSEKIQDTAMDSGKYHIPRSEALEDILENLTMSGRKKYVGKKITMNLKSVRPDEILKMIAETSGFNIIMTEDVKKMEAITLSLSDVPWDQALDTILDLSKLVVTKNGVILFVTTFETAAKERELEKKAKESLVELEPLVTKIFPISYAKIGDLKDILSEYSSDKTPGAKKADGKGKISIDTRTNSLIVKDIAEVIERMKKIVELLDTQTPQVLIESKIVEVSERYSKEIGLDQGIAFGYDPFSIINASNNAGSFSFSTAPSSTRSLFGLSITRFNRLLDVNFKLNLMESESKGKIISSPKIITKNNVAATITQDESSYYLENTVSATSTGSTTTQSWKSQSSKLELNVTPQVTNEGSISLEVDVKKGSLSPSNQLGAPQDQVNRAVKTQVLVDNGATIVIGGIYSYSQSEFHSGIPFLKDIPLIGWLFRTKYNPTSLKNELIIFLTPRIINQEEAGLVDRG